MILQCPECNTRYLVPDAAIGPEGRTVRCATCRHSWFQEPAEAAAPADAPTVGGNGVAEPVAAERAYPAFAPEATHAASTAPAARPRRNVMRWWTAGAFAAGLLMLLAVAGIVWSGAPGIVAQFGLATAQGPQLQVESDPVQRRYLDNGSVLFAVSGRVVNPTGAAQRVPDLRVDLLDRADGKGRSVYDWTITPQARTIPPHGTMEFNSSKLDVPQAARQLRLSFAGEDPR